MDIRCLSCSANVTVFVASLSSSLFVLASTMGDAPTLVAQTVRSKSRNTHTFPSLAVSTKFPMSSPSPLVMPQAEHPGKDNNSHAKHLEWCGHHALAGQVFFERRGPVPFVSQVTLPSKLPPPLVSFSEKKPADLGHRPLRRPIKSHRKQVPYCTHREPKSPPHPVHFCLPRKYANSGVEPESGGHACPESRVASCCDIDATLVSPETTSSSFDSSSLPTSALITSSPILAPGTSTSSSTHITGRHFSTTDRCTEIDLPNVNSAGKKSAPPSSPDTNCFLDGKFTIF
mmetsp:Transcript_5645/g.21364  ORF Transcript_5645/g.21364 Transcript_5645/m.21364 type:complete len:287 (-) Transcript_5645:1236-2096(-)